MKNLTVGDLKPGTKFKVKDKDKSFRRSGYGEPEFYMPQRRDNSTEFSLSCTRGNPYTLRLNMVVERI